MRTSDETEAVFQETNESSQDGWTRTEGHRPELRLPPKKQRLLMSQTWGLKARQVPRVTLKVGKPWCHLPRKGAQEGLQKCQAQALEELNCEKGE